MTSLAERTGISIPQPEIENMPDLVVPVDVRKRFQQVTRAAGEEAVPLRFLAAAVLHDQDKERSTEEIVESAQNLAAVDEYLQHTPRVPLVHVGYTRLETGITAETGSGVFFRNSYVNRYRSPHIIIPTALAYSAHLATDGSSHFNRSELGNDAVRYDNDQIEMLFLSETVLSPVTKKASIDEAVDIMDKGVLAVGEKPVSDFLRAIAERELGEGNRLGDHEYEYSLALLGAAALRNQGAELRIGTKGDLIHETVREMLARLVARGLGDRHYHLGSMGRVSRRLSAAALSEADIKPISEEATALLTRTTAHEGLSAMARQNGGSLEKAAQTSTRNILQNLMGVELRRQTS